MLDAMETDFIALYRDLGIEPECSPDDFKRAYRRRVSELHPDRVGGSEESLKSLNLGYAAALDFHRAHGRFPGASSPRTPPAAQRTGEAFPTTPVAGARDDDAHEAPRSRWLLLVLLALLALFAASQFMSGDTRTAQGHAPAGAVARTAVAPSPEPARATQPLLVGMSGKEAAGLLGSPLEIADDGRQWLYGPSWVRVLCGQVVDWYSSPLKPLGASRTRPRPQDVRDDYVPGDDCAQAGPATPAAAAY